MDVNARHRPRTYTPTFATLSKHHAPTTHNICNTQQRTHATMHKYIHAYTHTHIHAQTHIHTYTHTHIHTYTHTHIHTYTHTHIHTYTHTYTHTHLHTYTHTHLHTYLHTYILTYLHTYILTYLHTFTERTCDTRSTKLDTLVFPRTSVLSCSHPAFSLSVECQKGRVLPHLRFARPPPSLRSGGLLIALFFLSFWGRWPGGRRTG